jgi:hypothetical protein
MNFCPKFSKPSPSEIMDEILDCIMYMQSGLQIKVLQDSEVHKHTLIQTVGWSRLM